MIRPPRIDARLFARLPAALHHEGEPNDWVRMTRPGQRLHSFIEGPCFDAGGRLWLVDVPYGRIFRIEPGGEWTLARQYDGKPHSLRPLDEDSFAIVDYRRGLLRLDARSGAIEPLAVSFEGEPFLGLSDLAVARSGDIWFTDSGRTSLSDPRGRVFRLDRAGALRLVLANVPYPNGIALSPDEAFVYVAATRANAVWRLSAVLPAEGPPMAGTYVTLGGGLGPDGLAVDRAGRLAVAHAQAGRAFVFDRLGDPLAEIRLPEGMWTTSVCFDPGSGQTLYITEAQTGSVYTADLASLENASHA